MVQIFLRHAALIRIATNTWKDHFKIEGRKLLWLLRN